MLHLGCCHEERNSEISGRQRGDENVSRLTAKLRVLDDEDHCQVTEEAEHEHDGAERGESDVLWGGGFVTGGSVRDV